MKVETISDLRSFFARWTSTDPPRPIESESPLSALERLLEDFDLPELGKHDRFLGSAATRIVDGRRILIEENQGAFLISQPSSRGEGMEYRRGRQAWEPVPSDITKLMITYVLRETVLGALYWANLESPLHTWDLTPKNKLAEPSWYPWGMCEFFTIDESPGICLLMVESNHKDNQPTYWIGARNSSAIERTREVALEWNLD